MIATENQLDFSALNSIDAHTLDQLAQTALELESAYKTADLSALLEAHPEAVQNPTLLDAAIEHAIDSMRRNGTDLCTATESLAATYPEFASPIRRAGCLSLIFDNLSLQSTNTTVLTIGQRIGPIIADNLPRYEIVSECGRGSNAVIYKALDHRMSDDQHSVYVALKVSELQAQTLIPRPSEGVLASIAGHPNVVQVFDRGTVSSDLQYVAMELSGIGSLHSFPSMDDAGYVRLIRDVARGLHAAHSAGVVHGDIKPDNILLFGNPEDTDSLVPKLADFGVSKSLKLGYSSNPHSEISESNAGNLAFMAPEVWAGARPTIQSDVYSIAAMLRYLLTNIIDRGNFSANRLNDEESYPKIKGRLTVILERATDPDPELRTSTAVEFANHLEAFLSHKAIRGIDSPSRTAHLFSRRHPVTTATVLACSILLIAGTIGAAYTWQGWVYESARRTTSMNVAQWHQQYKPAFSDRSSVYDLASRYALARSNEHSDAFDWATTAAPDIDTEISQLAAILSSLPSGSLDTLLVREHLIFRQLQSRKDYKDTTLLLDVQRDALAQSGFLTTEESELIDLLSAVHAVKIVVMNAAPLDEVEEDKLEMHFLTLSSFLNARGLLTSSGLSEAARRDPRVRLASRAAHWLSSPKMLDKVAFHQALDSEYGITIAR